METLVTEVRVSMDRSTVAVRLEHTSHVPCTKYGNCYAYYKYIKETVARDFFC